MPDMLEKIEQVYKYKIENGLDYDIEVDGGINLQNLPLVLSAGANVVVAGSSVFAKDMIAENTKAFVNALNSDGVANNG
jgi:ribulose-phosphate 3-epimerase